MIKILVVHGPNLDLLGKRQPEIYGTAGIGEIDARLKELASQNGAAIESFQSNHEGEIVSKVGRAGEHFNAVVMNPAAYTHTSVAIRDAVAACGIPVVEVHLSNIYAREDFRHQSLVAPVAAGQVSGFGVQSYELGFLAALRLAQKGPKK